MKKRIKKKKLTHGECPNGDHPTISNFDLRTEKILTVYCAYCDLLWDVKTLKVGELRL